MFYNHDGMKLEINNRRKFGKFTNMWKLNNTLLNNQWVKEKNNKLENILKLMKTKTTAYPDLLEATKATFRGKFKATA